MIKESGLKEIRKILEKGWDKNTTANKVGYNRKPKSWGQCYVTAMVIHDIFGGDIIKSRNINHYWNRLPSGEEIDLTSDQFKKGDGIHLADECIGTGKLCKFVFGMRIKEIANSKARQNLPNLSEAELKKKRWLLLLKRVEKPLQEFKKQLQKKK